MAVPERVLAGLLVVPFLLGASASAADTGRPELEFADPEIVESSGLVVRDGRFVTVNDSGDSARVFVVDPATGQTVGVSRWGGEPFDVEALAPAARGSVWVGDIGDNQAVRDSVQVVQVPVGRGDVSVEDEGFDLVYPDGSQDAEALLAHPVTGRLYVASKGVFGGTLYAAPLALRADRPNELRPIGDVGQLVTDGAFFPDGRHLVLRSYTRATVYTFPALEVVSTFPLPEQEQGEGLAIDAAGDLFVSTEGQFTQVLRVPLPGAVRRAVAAPSATAEPSPSASPGTRSRAGLEYPQTTDTERPWWPWFLGGGLGLGAIVALVLALRRR